MIRLGAYDVERPLGRGGLATVYLARHRATGTEAAVKVVHPGRGDSAAEQRGRLGHETMMLETVRGPHVPRVLEFGTADHMPYLAMTVAGDQSLADVLRTHEPCTTREARDAVLQLADALQAIHDMGVLHMDLTPSNIMLRDGQVRIIDFGAARALAGSPLAGPTSYDGTAGYVAPERCLGARPNTRMDVFSLGAVVYRALLGVRPYADPRSLDVSRCISPKRLIPPHLVRNDINPYVSDLLLRTLSLDPASRPESPRAFGEEFAVVMPSRWAGMVRAGGA